VLAAEVVWLRDEARRGSSERWGLSGQAVRLLPRGYTFKTSVVCASVANQFAFEMIHLIS
jgi:hypothetical protein